MALEVRGSAEKRQELRRTPGARGGRTNQGRAASQGWRWGRQGLGACWRGCVYALPRCPLKAPSLCAGLMHAVSLSHGRPTLRLWPLEQEDAGFSPSAHLGGILPTSRRQPSDPGSWLESEPRPSPFAPSAPGALPVPQLHPTPIPPISVQLRGGLQGMGAGGTHATSSPSGVTSALPQEGVR